MALQQTYQLPRGSTWSIVIPITKLLQPVNLTGHHVVVTVRQMLVDGTADAVSPVVWQGDNALLGGVTLATQSGPTLGVCYSVMPSTATLSLPNPTQPLITLLYYDVRDNDTNGPLGTWQTEYGYIQLTPSVGLTPP